ncbi:tyrosine-protein phosphatase 69D isoform X2 [Bacillus rossius redtenbacheri]|uniref:tyrosine-protein phosphatase 69D isoform X2 n=1 Tax=Bacillus rossius redtenbacheri TaxID=93214 RepID=UPI002FDDB3F4
MWEHFVIYSNRRDRFYMSGDAMTRRCSCNKRIINALFILFFTSLVCNVAELQKIEILDVQANSVYTSCDNISLACTVRPKKSIIWWTSGASNITGEDRYLEDGDVLKHVLHVGCSSFEDTENFTCHAAPFDDQDKEIAQTIRLDRNVPLEIVRIHGDHKNLTQPATLTCEVKGFPIVDIKWEKLGDTASQKHSYTVNITKGENGTWVKSELIFSTTSRKDNGTYLCMAVGRENTVNASADLFVHGQPQVKIDHVKAVGAHSIFLNWTVNDGNDAVIRFVVQKSKNGSKEWTYNTDPIYGNRTSYIWKDLEPNTAYNLKLSAENLHGISTAQYAAMEKTLAKDPEFIPEISVKGFTRNSITVGWSSPPDDVKDHVTYYTLNVRNNHIHKEAIPDAQSNNLYLFLDLEPATTYHFKVAACNEYTKCGNWSEEVNGTTMDGESSPPENVSLVCRFDNISRTSFVFVSWLPPLQPNGKIVHYNVILEGIAVFKNDRNVMQEVKFNTQKKFVNEKLNSTRFDMVPANTNYTVKVSGVTRSKSRGAEAVVHCQMPPTVPDRDQMNHFTWTKVEYYGKWLFRLTLPRVSERNGPICCYRIFVLKLEPQQSVADLPHPEDIPISSYDEVHSKRGGAYVAEMFDSDTLNVEVFIGDGQTANASSAPCRHCAGVLIGSLHTPSVTPPLSGTEITSVGDRPPQNDSLALLEAMFSDLRSSASPAELMRVRRAEPASAGHVLLPMPSSSAQTANQEPELKQQIVYDGQLDTTSNYTGFVEVIVVGAESSQLSAYSGYFRTLSAGPEVLQADESPQVLVIVLQVLCGLVLVVLLLLLSLCTLQHYTKQVAEAQGVEMTFTSSFRSLRGRQVLVSSSPPDMSPVSKSQLVAAYVERHRDSDYGFQQEFEMLPERFPDRTTRHSELRENLYKNRYPDIKTYDQTRVKLSQIDSVMGSDYINANFVIGYRERKKFICAQGPMDNTVCDFWRMIWEQHLEMILMLTNLEEYSKTKCSKYWPDDSEGEKIFGDFTVTHVQEKRYSDYIIRELKLCRLSYSGKEQESRSIVQFHYLVWKDFMAPEHPSGILKFIKRINEAYSLEKGPILVHCSAGVGRTGTLVALDSLLQQLKEEEQVSIFNTVCDLRHQRNFLVQSLKQYIFIYRALMEVAQFGDTEIEVSGLKIHIEKLKKWQNGKEKCLMEEEFEKLNLVLEDHKSYSVGDGEENRSKNRSDLVIPYDRNRVMLTPVPGREHSTYINASFIEGYDNWESFIITQDPLESTIGDFWRMMFEQNVNTLVMLSDLGDGQKKCPRYWPDDEASYDHIRVKYIQSESCPYYTRREFCITNTKIDENLAVTQFQYNGWPTVEGEVPEVTRGLIELVDQTQSHQDTFVGAAPIVVHCNCGADRSSIFVALSTLVQQLRTEKRIDIFTTTRNLRSQRNGMLQTFAQYEFLHRAVVNYADLHHLASDEA